MGKLSRGPDVRWNYQPIKITASLKYMGVILDEKLKWISHNQEQEAKAVSQYQQLCRVARPGWGLKKNTKGYSTKQLRRGFSFMELMLGHSLFLPDWRINGLNSEDLPPLHYLLLQNHSNSNLENYYRYHVITS
ncbi:hypothetical protein AVEN_162141-1 [Araneus ventricosus]|uniref:Reverse transcriptase domain-containing protein n=1 Tax=Araneus ventricosus TaxID=182803 RepID=A0A4Y2J6C7_ARAVE|nr:hypothetical protein AVEN_162141-1 [Araneus ventricosus]